MLSEPRASAWCGHCAHRSRTIACSCDRSLQTPGAFCIAYLCCTWTSWRCLSRRSRRRDRDHLLACHTRSSPCCSALGTAHTTQRRHLHSHAGTMPPHSHVLEKQKRSMMSFASNSRERKKTVLVWTLRAALRYLRPHRHKVALELSRITLAHLAHQRDRECQDSSTVSRERRRERRRSSVAALSRRVSERWNSVAAGL